AERRLGAMLEEDVLFLVVQLGDERIELLLGGRGQVEGGVGNGGVLGHGESPSRQPLLPGRFEPQHALGVGGVGRIVAGMELAVVDHDLGEIERRDALEAGNVDRELVGVRAALVVGIDAAHRAEMMLGDARVEAVGGELVGAFEDPESVMGRSHRDRPAHPADRAGAAPRRGQPKRQLRRELHCAAMARAVERDRIARLDVDHAATFSSTPLTASSASCAFEPSGPPPWAMSGRPPPPCPPSAVTAALTRSTALTWPARSSVTPTATLARPSLTATRAATPEPTRCFIVSTVERSSLGSSPSTTWPRNLWPPTSSGPASSALAAPPPIASAFFASASSRSSRLRSSTSAAIRAGTSSGDDFRVAAASRNFVSRSFSHCRAASPVSASMRRTPAETALSEMILSSWMSPSARTWVPPHSSTE